MFQTRDKSRHSWFRRRRLKTPEKHKSLTNAEFTPSAEPQGRQVHTGCRATQSAELTPRTSQAQSHEKKHPSSQDYGERPCFGDKGGRAAGQRCPARVPARAS
ncbi:hypothetical protein PR003_g32206 [Phytophthora rubi]|uniref:Uncharacterized protein n=1 Tax=Phytophthora rubi TaxID=129364 RepID=A0A6A3GQ67_9STRA|nr:hypothetical protein PR001_g30985 [Phytophthora rubi]KAE9266204.1 hypothetical protein PR003_g32206 [Phytophthora rubi]